MKSLFKNELIASKSRVFFISPEKIDIIAIARMFFLILLSYYSFCVIHSWIDINHWDDFKKFQTFRNTHPDVAEKLINFQIKMPK